MARGFLITPFSAETAGGEDTTVFAAVQEAIRAAAEETGLDLRRADDIFAAGVVIQQVQGEIEQADVVLAVCSGRNANVFYELGWRKQQGSRRFSLRPRRSTSPLTSAIFVRSCTATGSIRSPRAWRSRSGRRSKRIHPWNTETHPLPRVQQKLPAAMPKIRSSWFAETIALVSAKARAAGFAKHKNGIVKSPKRTARSHQATTFLPNLLSCEIHRPRQLPSDSHQQSNIVRTS